MRWRNTETPTFAGSDGTKITGPDVVEAFDLVDRDGNVVGTFSKDVAGALSFALSGSLAPTSLDATTLTQGGVGVLITATGLRVARAKYSFAVDSGAQGLITPADSDTIPDNAIIVGGTINSTTAVTSDGSATVSIGTSAGSSTTSIKAATAKASYSADAVLNAVPVFATPVKLTAAGTITFTIGTADLTAGVIEVFLFYVVAAA
jgi:hypothetical protein